MSKQTKYFLIGFIFLIIVVVAYYLFFKKDKKYTTATTNTINTFDFSKCSYTIDSTLNFNKVLKIGVNSCETARLQKELNNNISAPFVGLKIDGYFGSATEAQLLKQKGVKETTLNKFKGFAL